MTDVAIDPGPAPAEPVRSRVLHGVKGSVAIAALLLVVWAAFSILRMEVTPTSDDWAFPVVLLFVLALFVQGAIGLAWIFSRNRTVPVASPVSARRAGIASVITFAAVITSVEVPLAPHGHVGTPADSAGPTTVVTAYVKALNAHDNATVAALEDPAFQQHGDPFVRITLLSIDGSGPDQDPDRAGDYGVSIAVDWTWRDLDSSGTTNGRHIWGYILAPTGPHGAWRILDQGVG